MKRFCNRVRHRVVMTWIRFHLWWFMRQWTKKSRRVKQIMEQRENRFGELRADNARLRDQLDHALDALRASHGGCRMPSVGDDCDCGLCKRDRQITDLQAIVAKLDKTADGVHVIPHKTAVYHPELADNEGVLDSLYVDACGWAHGVDHRGWEHGTDRRNTLFHRRVSDCYSTPEVALAAKP